MQASLIPFYTENIRKRPRRPAALLKKEALAQVFSSKFCEISKNTFFLQNTSDGCFCISGNCFWKFLPLLCIAIIILGFCSKLSKIFSEMFVINWIACCGVNFIPIPFYRICFSGVFFIKINALIFKAIPLRSNKESAITLLLPMFFKNLKRLGKPLMNLLTYTLLTAL